MDGFWEDDLDLWDTAAGVLLVREAGGFVTDYRGADRAFERGEYVAASSASTPSCKSSSPGRCDDRLPLRDRCRTAPRSRRRC